MQIETTWWISAIEAPIVGALFLLIHGLRREILERLDRSDQREAEALSRAQTELAEFKLEVARGYAPLAASARGADGARDELNDFKLEVARTYVPLSVIRDVDRRLSAQLLRIEEKIESMRRDDPPFRSRGQRATEDSP